ncbi:MAG TPA: guanylate kinase [Verrucomicrobiae bacterium]|nr:guanylate kinase [Verrucomicrobiae bacterium]
MNELQPPAARPGLIIVVSAPSGGGKSSLCQRLLNWSPNTVYSVSCTTRAPRGGEQNGRDYFFLTPDEFERRIAADEFLEYAQYNGNYYGTPRQFVEEQVAAGRDVLLDIEVQGAAQVVRCVRGSQGFAYPDALITIFLLPPSLELLETRLRRRGTDSEEMIRKRLLLAQQEMAHWREYDYVILTGHLDDDFERGKAIVTAEKCRTARVPKGGQPWQKNELSF